MFFPEFLFRLSKRDEQITWLDPVFIRPAATTGANNSLSATIYTVPTDRSLVLKNLLALLDPGAGQAAIAASVSITAPSGTSDALVQAMSWAVVADLNQHLNWEGEIIVPPNWRVSANATYNGAVQVNSLDTSLIGLLMPVGNLQRI